ncbi:MAG: rsmG [Chloroflexi bacterium]|nr:rsmG [Chloroflexota bacterium]
MDAAALEAIERHVRLLLAWNAAINLTAITDPEAIARLHVADSLSALDLVRAGPHGSLLDLGSGGGFPGLPLALVLPGTRVLLVESVAKKAAFLEAARRALGLEGRVDVAAVRVESLVPPSGKPAWDVMTARAVGSLADLVELALPVLAPGGRLVAWKRGEITAELEGAGRAAAVLGGSEPEVRTLPSGAGLDGHALVVVRRERPSPAGYPRDPAVRKRRPW